MTWNRSEEKIIKRFDQQITSRYEILVYPQSLSAKRDNRIFSHGYDVTIFHR